MPNTQKDRIRPLGGRGEICREITPWEVVCPTPPSGLSYIQSSPYFDPTHTLTGWIGQPPILDRLEVVTDNGDVDTLRQATP